MQTVVPFDINALVFHFEHQKTYPIELKYHTCIDSTNTYLKTHPSDDFTKISVCIAEEQTQGRGRLGRTWHSPAYQNIYCSIKYPKILFKTQKIDGLSVFISLCLMKTLSHAYPSLNFKIKWPNDILFDHQKISGILIETTIHQDLIIGFGINVNSSFKEQINDKSYPWGSLYDITGEKQNRTHLLIALLEELLKKLPVFFNQGLRLWMPEWEKVDYLFGKKIQIQQGHQNLIGIADGIDTKGALFLKDEKKRHLIYSGDASIIIDHS